MLLTMRRNWNLLYTASGNATCCSHFGKQSGGSSKSRVTMYMTQRFHSWALYSREPKTYVHTKSCTQMFTTALFTIARSGNNPNVYQWMNG